MSPKQNPPSTKMKSIVEKRSGVSAGRTAAKKPTPARPRPPAQKAPAKSPSTPKKK